MRRRLLFHLTIPVVLISVLLLAVGMWAAWRVQHLQQAASRAVLENASAMRAAEELEILVREARTRLGRLRQSGERSDREALTALRGDMEHWMGEVERWSFSPREFELAGRARRGWNQFRDELEHWPTAPNAPEFARLERLLTQGILAPTHEFLDLNETEVEESVTENQAAADQLVFGLLLLGVCGASGGLVAGFWLARRFIERLERSERAALHAEQLAALGHLAAGMAHELRNPITTIRMLVQAALTEMDFDGHKELGTPALAGRDLSIVDEEVTRLESLVRSFLDFARPPSPERRVVELRKLVRETLELIAERAAAAGVAVAFDPQEQPVYMAVDPGQFRQVVLNLTLNALDALPSGGRMNVELRKESAGKVILRVADDGSGLPAEIAERIFEPFVTSKPTGLGLGLSICKRIMEAHGGTIMAASRPAGGTEFVVCFPASASARAPGAVESRRT